ncbi:MAG: hypothetical protein L3K16_06925 [Thermoplasmata archaeon]|nr:hypothetical protein [Thermoplasmata archaeon]
MDCAPSVAGNYSIQVEIQDSWYSSWVTNVTLLEVFAPLGPAIVLPSQFTLDVGQVLTLSAVSNSPGSGIVEYLWAGLPPGCPAPNSHSVSCLPTQAGVFQIAVTTTDRAGAKAGPSSPVDIRVFPKLSVSGLTASQTRIDLGQSIEFSVNATGGSGSYVYAWSGLPTACASQNSSSIVCRAGEPGDSSVRVNLTDSSGGSFSAAPLAIEIAPALNLSVTAPPAIIRLGSPLTLNVSISGGTPNYLLTYSGLPPGCTSSNLTRLTCTPTSDGTFAVSLKASDAAGGTAESNITVQVESALSTPNSSPWVWDLVAVGLGVVLAAAVVVWYLHGRTKHHNR